MQLEEAGYDLMSGNDTKPDRGRMPMSTNPIESRLLELIHAKTGVLPQIDDTFDALKIDSLGMAELTAEIEKAFDIRIGEDIMGVANIRELIEYVERKTAS